MKHTFTSSVGWFTLALLLALSPQLAGCDTDPKSEISTGALPTEQAIPQDKVTSAAAVQAQPQQAILEHEKSKKDVAEASSDASQAKGNKAPEVRRLVIASDVDGREPVKLEQGAVDQPVVAFVEMRNLAAEDSKIVVTFEHESGKKVGFIELAVPKESSRYRTWGRTHNIRDVGKWTAIVATESGQELARESFSVSG
jgi:hypothetical protein